MNEINQININDYNYNLPDDRIAQHPVNERDSSQLLVFKKDKISGDKFKNIAKYLPSDSLLVFNNTRVIRARILFTKSTGAAIEVFCLEPVKPAEYQQSFASTNQVEWKCIIGNLKKWKSGTITTEFDFKGTRYELSAEKVNNMGEAWRIKFRWNPGEINFGEVIKGVGHIPLPPYIKREDEEEDYIRYQTVYSIIKGSVASPTAGLHFTNEVLNSIRNKGLATTEITLHVGAGTFQPVKTSKISEHEMHCEHYFVTGDAIEKMLLYRNKIIAVGTTSVRTLESLYWLGVQILESKNKSDEFFTDQWEYYQHERECSMEESFNTILSHMRKRNITLINASTKILILPGYRFRVINGMITNFHQPKSTLLLLISAWVGEKWKEVYDYALANNYRFLSYGDSSLLLNS